MKKQKKNQCQLVALTEAIESGHHTRFESAPPIPRNNFGDDGSFLFLLVTESTDAELHRSFSTCRNYYFSHICHCN
jgi:hypothetical protein